MVEIHEVRAGDVAFAKGVLSGGPAERPANVEDDRRIIGREPCCEFVTIEQERYHSVRIPQ
jgi:hypothetical protein